MVRTAGLKQKILVNHLEKCRLCLKAFSRRNKKFKISTTVKIRFLELTSLELIVQPGYSNNICDACNVELKRISEFRRDLIFKQACLDQLVASEESHVEEFVKIKVEPEVVEGVNDVDPVIIKSEVFDETSSLPDCEAREFSPPPPTSTAPTILRTEIHPEKSTKPKRKRIKKRPTVELFCDHCGFMTVIKYVLQTHLKSHIPKEFREKFQCTKCEMEFLSKHAYKKHIASHDSQPGVFNVEGVFECEVCELSFPNKVDLGKHKTNQHKASQPKNHRVECKFCGVSQFNKQSYKKHIQRMHKDENDESLLSSQARAVKSTGWLRNAKEEIKVPKKQAPTKPVATRMCMHCGLLMKNTAFRSHVRRRHPDTSIKFQCDHCERFYHIKQRLATHMIRHTPRELRQKYVCRFCKQAFVSALGRDNHVQQVHENTEKNFKCEFCEKSFMTSLKLKSHTARMHQFRKFSCHLCSQRFTLNLELKKHIKQRHTDQPEIFCDICGQKSASIMSLRAHKKHLHTERTFECDFTGCDKKFVSESHLKLHQKVHNGQKDFVCSFPDCGKAYFASHNLQIHMKIIHENLRKPCPVDGCSFSVGRLDYMKSHLMKHSELDEEERGEYLKLVMKMGLV